MAKFQDAIDTRFPYADSIAAAAVIARGRHLSLADDTSTLSEICRPPRSVDVTPARLSALLAIWASGFDHPLKPVLLECAEARIARRSLTCDRALEIMNLIGRHRGLYAALNLAVETADCDDAAGFAQVEALEGEIRAKWLDARG